LWRLYSYWRLEERDGGVYVELESIGLSRSVPVFFAWLVNPLLKSLPKSYLSRVLNSTRTALTKSRLTERIHEEGAADSFQTRCSSRIVNYLIYHCFLFNKTADTDAQPMGESAAKLRPFTRVSKAYQSEPFRSVSSPWLLQTQTYAIWVARRQGFCRGQPMQIAKWQVELTNCLVPLRSKPVV